MGTSSNQLFRAPCKSECEVDPLVQVESSPQNLPFLHSTSALTFTYTYNETAAGQGVDIYIIGKAPKIETVLEY